MSCTICERRYSVVSGVGRRKLLLAEILKLRLTQTYEGIPGVMLAVTVGDIGVLSVPLQQSRTA